MKSRKSAGREPFLTAAQKAELRALVIRGSDPAVHEVTRWRCADLRAQVARRWSVEVHESTISAWLGGDGFQKNFAGLVRAALAGSTSATPIEIWFQDEARVGEQGTHGYIWAPVGARPLMVRDNRHDSAYIFGAIWPQRGVGAAMIAPAANTEMMNLHLAEISTQVAADAIAVLTCDGAG